MIFQQMTKSLPRCFDYGSHCRAATLKITYAGFEPNQASQGDPGTDSPALALLLWVVWEFQGTTESHFWGWKYVRFIFYNKKIETGPKIWTIHKSVVPILAVFPSTQRQFVNDSLPHHDGDAISRQSSRFGVRCAQVGRQGGRAGVPGAAARPRARPRGAVRMPGRWGDR